MAILKFAFCIYIVLQSTVVAKGIDARSARDRLADDSCQDCMEILDLFADVISHNDTEANVFIILERVCHQLPGLIAQELCLGQVKQNLPTVIQLLTDFIKTNQICKVLGVCKSESQGMEQEVLTNEITKIHTSHGRGTMTWHEIPTSLQCTFCMLVFKSLDAVIPTTETIVVKLVAQVCRILPGGWSGSCREVVECYVQRILHFLLSWLTPRNVCRLLRFCSRRDPSTPDCDSCRMLALLSRFHLGFNATDAQASAFLESVCRLYHSLVPECEAFSRRYAPVLLTALKKPGGIQDQCEEALLCKAEHDSGAARGSPGGPCRKDSYRCRDMETAEQCNSVAFCQTYVWK